MKLSFFVYPCACLALLFGNPCIALGSAELAVEMQGSVMRPGTGLMDIDFIVHAAGRETVPVSIVGFRGEHESDAMVRGDRIVPMRTFVEGTERSLGDDVPANVPLCLTWDGIARYLREHCPEVQFALVHGSAATGVIGLHSDLDLAIYTSKTLSLHRMVAISQEITERHQGVRCDLGILNRADPVYAFETLKGKRILCRCESAFARFYSETCRRYEFAMAAYQRQKAHRIGRQAQSNQTEGTG